MLTFLQPRNDAGNKQPNNRIKIVAVGSMPKEAHNLSDISVIYDICVSLCPDKELQRTDA